MENIVLGPYIKGDKNIFIPSHIKNLLYEDGYSFDYFIDNYEAFIDYIKTKKEKRIIFFFGEVPKSIRKEIKKQWPAVRSILDKNKIEIGCMKIDYKDFSVKDIYVQYSKIVCNNPFSLLTRYYSAA